MYMYHCINYINVHVPFCHTLLGDVLSTVDTRQMENSFAAVSPCGRFVGSSGKVHLALLEC